MNDLDKYTDDELRDELKRRAIERRKNTPREIIYKEFEATVYKVYNIKDTYNGRERFLPFSQWDYRVTDIVCDYKGVVIPDVFRLACGVFTKSNAPKVGDRVKLRYRIHKKTFEGFDMAKARIVEIIKA